MHWGLSPRSPAELWVQGEIGCPVVGEVPRGLLGAPCREPPNLFGSISSSENVQGSSVALGVWAVDETPPKPGDLKGANAGLRTKPGGGGWRTGLKSGGQRVHGIQEAEL